MKKILILVIAIATCFAHAGAAVRDGNTVQRAGQKRVSTTPVAERATTSRTTVLNAGRGNARTASPTTTRVQTNVVQRARKPNTKNNTNVAARAAVSSSSMVSETRTGAAYETCKNAFFTCMDQFCALKNDDYRRCSCSSRIDSMEKQRSTLTDAGQQLTVFTENLDVVGLTAAQATAMRTASEGENALANDTSASKALLQAIMNSISGGDTTVGGKYSDLNTINMTYDLTTIFGADANQIVASYNGVDLYSAVYPQCRHAVADDCNDASLQRAINAYLMAIEQDCNTVQTAIDEKRAQMKSAIREGSAMLDLARVENRRNHNSDDITTCINNVESAILSEEVCGANYHKCLDNGEFIDISTGAPITGVPKFYELGNLLTFAQGVDAANQRLSTKSNNRTFVLNFEKRTKKFAEPALDKCTEIADEVWAEYLDKAMLAIYYAQQSKVAEIKQGCFDFVARCYADSDTSITAAMAELIGSAATVLQPDKIALTTQMCTDYVESCNNMFLDAGAGDIIEQYVNTRQSTDTLAACRAIVKQCFDKYGGSGYENFYYPYSGLFNNGAAGDWFALYDRNSTSTGYISPCARQLANVDACKDLVEEAFGGFDRMYTIRPQSDVDDQLTYDVVAADTVGAVVRYGTLIKKNSYSAGMRHRVLRPVGVATEVYNQIVDTLATQCMNINGRFVERQFIKENVYGGPNGQNMCLWYPQAPQQEEGEENTNSMSSSYYNNYAAIAGMYGIASVTTNENDDEGEGGEEGDNSETGEGDGDTGEGSAENQEGENTNENSETIYTISDDFTGENMCPRDYQLNVDTSFWGACLCWENGARRSKNGKNATCVPELPAAISSNSQQTVIADDMCYVTNSDNSITWQYDLSDSKTSTFYFWCTQTTNSDGQVCPYGYTPSGENGACVNGDGEEIQTEILKLIPKAM